MPPIYNDQAKAASAACGAHATVFLCRNAEGEVLGVCDTLDTALRSWHTSFTDGVHFEIRFKSNDGMFYAIMTKGIDVGTILEYDVFTFPHDFNCFGE